MYRVLRGGKLRRSCQIDPRNSWLLAAREKDLPIFVPGWEDPTIVAPLIFAWVLGW